MTQLIIPQGIRLSRKRGFKLQDYSHALNGLPAWRVARPSRFGNLFLTKIFGQDEAVRLYEEVLTKTDAEPQLDDNVRRWRSWVLENVHLLRGHNLACWCATPAPGDRDRCHRRILIELANR